MRRGWTWLVTACFAAAPIAGPCLAQRPVPRDSALLRRVIEEAWSAVVSAPQQGEDRAARLASVQTRSGDMNGALEKARRYAQTWVPFGYIAIARLDSGDVPGAIAAAAAAHTHTDRAQALGYVSSAFLYRGRIDSGVALARTITWPKEQVEQLKLAASLVRGRDTSRANFLLDEAIRVAQADTSFWGGYFDVELGYEQARAGNLAGALRVLVDTLSPETRAERLGRIAAELRLSARPQALVAADSLYGAAFRAVEQISDSAKRASMRGRVKWLTGFGAQFDPGRGVSLDSVARLEARGESRAAALELVPRLARMQRESPDSSAEIVRRTLDDARAVSEAFADTARGMLVGSLVSINSSLAPAIADSIRNPDLRARALLAMVRNLMWRDIPAAMALARSLPPSAGRDEFYANAATATSYKHPDEALAISRMIDGRATRARTMIAIASAATEKDRSLATRIYDEALPLLDPTPLSGRDLTALVELDAQRALDWARGQSSADRRAAAFVALAESAVVARRR